jgi:hypothetical protein
MKQKKAINFILNQEWPGTARDAIQPVIIKAFEAGGDTPQSMK